MYMAVCIAGVERNFEKTPIITFQPSQRVQPLPPMNSMNTKHTQLAYKMVAPTTQRPNVSRAMDVIRIYPCAPP
jgi:hypothetical protein